MKSSVPCRQIFVVLFITELAICVAPLLASLPEVENGGAFWVRRREALLQGELTDDGGEPTWVWVEYWPQAGGATSTVAVGTVGTGLFDKMVTGLNAGTEYAFRFGASNTSGTAWSGLAGFSTLSADPVGWYVTTNGPATAGTNWATAFGTVTGAVAVAEPGDTIYVAGGTYWVTNAVVIAAKTNLSLLGSYAATNASEQPGPWDFALWPTVLRRDTAYRTRILAMTNVQDILVRAMVLQDGYPNHNEGGGLRIDSSRNVTFNQCRFSGNRAQVIADHTSGAGGGAFVRNSSNVVFSGSWFTDNDSWGSSWHSRGLGGGLYTEGSWVQVWECFFSSNLARTSGGNSSYAWAYGAGLYVQSGTLQMGRTVVHSNLVSAGSMAARGGGLYINSGTVLMTNVLVTTNRTVSSGTSEGSGIYLAAGTATLVNVTVANNLKEGIRRVTGTLAITNSILWYNGFRDVIGQVNDLVSFTAVESGKSDPLIVHGSQGCTTNPPLFMDFVHFHKASEHGVYSGGFFGGGAWTNAPVTSLLIDAGDPTFSVGDEPYPNGGVINLGAYGGTPVASKSPPMSVLNLPVTFWDEESVFLNAQVQKVDSPPLTGRFYYGQSNGGTDSNAWQYVLDVGQLDGWPWSVSAKVQGLAPGETYYATFWVRNSTGVEVWGEPVVEFVPERMLPLLENTGVTNESGTSATLQGQILRPGSVSPPPSVWIVWGAEPGGKSVDEWAYQVSLGIQTGRFETEVSIEAGSNYWFTSYAVNSEGTNWAPAAIPFGSDMVRFVDTTANGNGSGYNWSNAYSRLQDALAACTSTRTNVIYLKGGVGGLFAGSEVSPLSITVSHVRVLGGFEGLTANGPGPRDPVQWPTILTRQGLQDMVRPLLISGAVNVTVDGVTLMGGETRSNPGGGLRIERSRDVSLENCRIISNRAVTVVDHTSAMGGGVYVLNATNVTIRRTFIQGNEATAPSLWHARGWGGGVYVEGSTVQLTESSVAANRTRTEGGNSAYAYAEGGGIYMNSGSLTVDRTLLWSNICQSTLNMPTRGGGLYVIGGQVEMENTVVATNSCLSTSIQGGGIHQAGGILRLYNITLADNWLEGIRCAAGQAVLTNCIVWGHSGADITGTVTIGYSCVGTGGDPGNNGNISTDPQFRLVEGIPYGLAEMSPCVDAGIDLPWQSRASPDLLGNSRIKGRRVDMGALESQARNAGTLMIIR